MSVRKMINVSLNTIAVLFTLIVPYAFMNKPADLSTIWNVLELEKSHIPPSDTSVSIEFASEEYYNSLPQHIIYKTFPVFAREFEPKKYLDSLRKLKPEVMFDPSKIRTVEDWIEAGRLVFNWPAAFSPVTDSVSSVSRKDLDGSSARLTSNGVYAFNRYVILENGELMRGSLSCASCHTKVTKDGTLIEGAQGNLFNNTKFANAVRTGRIPFSAIADGTKRLYFTPWAPTAHKMIASSPEEFASTLTNEGAGSAHRQGGSYVYPIKVPSLFDLKDVKYFDHTGLMKHNGPEDLMRYAALNQGMDMFTSYNGFIPAGKNNNTELPSPSEWKHPFGYATMRYSDEQLFALTKYIYSLQAPKNPDRAPKYLLAKGQLIFKEQGCVTCHTPPLYTNNKLTPVNGFEPRPDDFIKYDIFNISVETDSASSLYTRRGTGYYKVPSLRNIWLQEAFLHNGSVSTLEEFFDPARMNNKSKPSKGHPFGLTLSDADKKALIAFLDSL